MTSPEWKYKGIKISINNNTMKVSLKEDGRSIEKTYYHVNADFKFVNRQSLLNYLNGYLTKVLLM